jgi:hypothetical protein
MSKMQGLIIFFDEERRQDLLKERSEGGYETFSDALSVPDWELGKLGLALLSFSGTTIDYLAIVSRGRRVATSKYRVEFSKILDLHSVDVDVVSQALNANLKHHFIRSSQGLGSKIPVKTWNNVIEVIKKQRPDTARDIDRLCTLQDISSYRFSGEATDILLQEREAIGIALDIFSGSNKLRKDVIGSWAPEREQISEINEELMEAKLKKPTPGFSSFLSGIETRHLQEESALQHDLFSWDGITPMHDAGISIFNQGERKLEVIYANRNSLENTLGVDLIYYNEAYNSFMLVQYKLMKEENHEFVYRPDQQLNDELERMETFCKSFIASNKIIKHEDIRLNTDGFMLKLVPNHGIKPVAGELIKGMYVTREYMNFLIGANGPKGVKGGAKITFGNSPRYLTNTEFSQSVNRGWIGTRGVQSETLRKLIKQFYETGRAVLVAYESVRVSTN